MCLGLERVIYRRRLDDGRPNLLARAHYEVEYAVRQAGVRDDLGEGLSARWNQPGRFEDHRIAEGERGRDLPRRDRDGKVPGRDDSDDTDRFGCDFNADARTNGVDTRPSDPYGFARKELEYLSRAYDFADAFRQDLAFFTGQERPELVFAG